MIYFLLILASFIWGINVLVMKSFLEIVPIYFLAMLRVGLSMLSVFFIMKIKKEHFTKVDYKAVFKVSIFAITINFILTFKGMENISGTNNAIINALAPLVTIILSFLFLRRKIEKKQMFAMVIAIIGFCLSIDFNYFNLSIGHGLLFLGIISYCYANILIQNNRTADNFLSFTFFYLVLGFIELLIISLTLENNALSTLASVSSMSWFLFIIFSGIGFAYIQIVYLYAIKKIGSVKTSFFLSLNPVFTYLGSLFILHEEMDSTKVLAFSLMLLALFIANKKQKEKVRNHSN